MKKENKWNMTYFWTTSVSEQDLRFIIKTEVPDEVCAVKTWKISQSLSGIFGKSSELIFKIWLSFFVFNSLIFFFSFIIILTPFISAQ